MDLYSMGYWDGFDGLEPEYPYDDEYMDGYWDGEDEWYYDGWY